MNPPRPPPGPPPADELDELPLEARVDPDLVDLIPAFLENRRAELDVLRAALEAGRTDPARGIGHNLKGCGPSYGFDGLGVLGRALEQAGRSGDLAAAQRLAARLERYLDTVAWSPADAPLP